MPGALGFKGFNAVGVMWDWASLYQPPFASADEEASFCHARDDTMDIWFAHQGTAVYMLTQHPKARGAARSHGYRESGWTTFERCCAEQLKHCFLTDCRWRLVVDLGEGLQPTLDDCLRSERYAKEEVSAVANPRRMRSDRARSLPEPLSLVTPPCRTSGSRRSVAGLWDPMTLMSSWLHACSESLQTVRCCAVFTVQ